MRPPDQIPDRATVILKRGELCYLWTGKGYSEKTVMSPHTNYAAVTIADGNGPMIVKPEEVISAEQFWAEQREEKRENYADVIAHWETGRRTAKEMCESSKTGTVLGWWQRIAAAERWGLISDDPKPSDSNSSAGG